MPVEEVNVVGGINIGQKHGHGGFHSCIYDVKRLEYMQKQQPQPATLDKPNSTKKRILSSPIPIYVDVVTTVKHHVELKLYIIINLKTI
jgi:hypothetical protein